MAGRFAVAVGDDDSVMDTQTYLQPNKNFARVAASKHKRESSHRRELLVDGIGGQTA